MTKTIAPALKRNELLATNSSIQDPKGAYLALREVDLEHLAAKGLQTEIVFYCTHHDWINRSMKINARFEGKILIRNSHQDDFPYVALPSPRYTRVNAPVEPSREEFPEGHMPLELVEKNRLDHLEFVFQATNTEEYAGLSAFVRRIIPVFFSAGYDRYNPGHASVAWLYAGYENPQQTTVFSVGPNGLEINRTCLSDGSSVLTEKMVKRLRELRA